MGSTLLAGLLFASLTPGQSWPQTRAERTGYAETSHHADVVQFLSDLQAMGAPVVVQSTGKSTEGREMPLAIVSWPPVSSPAEARRLGKPIVFVQANIHAGEVEGKEASLMVLRRLCQEAPHGLLSKIVLLVAPIYNADGNEKWGPVEKNRPEQDGPALVGVRSNGQGFDLNRDAIKAESPEMRGLLEHVYSTWDPDVMMDLHTTDGTRHGWELTYSPPLNPNTAPGVMKLSRDQLIPSVRRSMMKDFGLPLFDYGNAETRDKKQAWYSFGQEGRYCTNYVGLRNRIAILSEATTYIPFKARVEVTDKFVMSVLSYVASHSAAVLKATRGADAQVVAWGLDPSKAPALGVRFDFESRGVEEVLLEKRAGASSVGRGASGSSGAAASSGAPRRPGSGTGAAGNAATLEPETSGQRDGSRATPLTTRPTQIEKVKMPVYDRFKATRTRPFPGGYLIPPSETKTVELLRRHGLLVERLVAPFAGSVETFTVSSFKQAEREFQGHKLVTLEGSFAASAGRADVGWFLVRTAQPLGVLAFHLLEPESLDGVAAWGYLAVTADSGFPILKVVGVPVVATVRVD